MEKVRVGVVGCGFRGALALNLAGMKDVVVTALCDKYRDKAEDMAERIYEKRNYKPEIFDNCDDLIADSNVDVVIDTTSWEGHQEVPIKAMKAGKPVGFEVGGAYSVQHCWDLVRTYQETKTPCMLLENCCYGRTELLLLNMAKQGLFGEIAHCRGGYQHDARNQIAKGEELRHYRMRNFLLRNCDNYPMHALGPIAKMLDINRGNKMLSLVSVASKAVGMREYIKENYGESHHLFGKDFAQGDVVTTIIKCARGETILLNLNDTLPRPYSRGLMVQGTKGFYNDETEVLYLDGMEDCHDSRESALWGNLKEFYEKYDHPLWKRTLKADGVVGGHGGMDGFVLRAFIESVKNGTPMPIDVYDAAAWKVITVLSEESIALGSMPVAIPDFTEGKWMQREEAYKWRYSLDHICDEDRIVFDMYGEYDIYKD